MILSHPRPCCAVPITRLVGLLQQAQQGEGEDLEELLQDLVDDAGESLLLQGAMLGRQLSQAVEGLHRERAMRQQAAQANARMYLELAEARSELAAARGALAAGRLAPSQQALEQAHARACRAEAELDAAKEETARSEVSRF